MLQHFLRFLRRPRINTFDVFDTMISRRVWDPKTVFNLVGERAGLPKYSENRMSIERAFWNGGEEYDLSSIYKRLAINMQLSDLEVDNLKTLELEMELKQVIPIVENMLLVHDGDALVSDMYLEEKFIWDLLRKASFDKNVELFVSARGKRSGAIWPRLKQQFWIKRHVGDSWHSDRASPRAAWIRSRITTAATPTNDEKFILSLGLPNLAATCRVVRLATWNVNPLLRQLQVVQANCNFPLLALASVALMRAARDVKASHILFSSRDCNLWQHVFARVLALSGEAGFTQEYFYTSRTARLQCSEDYRRYSADRIGSKSIVADIAGTGLSLNYLCNQIGVVDWNAYYIHKMVGVSDYEEMYSKDNRNKEHFTVISGEGNFRNWVFEACNYADHGSVQDMTFSDGKPVAIYNLDESPRDIMAAVKVQHTTFFHAIDELDNATVSEICRMSSEELKKAITGVYEILSSQESLRIAFKSFHSAEDRKAMGALGVTPPNNDEVPAAWRRVAAAVKRRVYGVRRP